MIIYIGKRRKHPIYRMLSGFVAMTFIVSVITPPSNVFAQAIPTTILNLPVPGTMVLPSNVFMPTLIKSITVHPDDPFKFNFLVDTGDSVLNDQEVKQEAHKLIKYFYAALTTPEKDMWVNLSPYEKDRIVPPNFGDTEMGRDLLAQDYILKQLTASLMYPEEETGAKFWDRVYQKAQQLYGTAEIPTDTFHKVWIVPETATIYEKGASAYVVESHLKVMLEDDYLALRTEKGVAADGSLNKSGHTISTDLIKEVLLPEIEKEVNEGENFSQLRQIYNTVILASWYKDNLKESLLGQVYVDQGKTKGVDVDDKQITQKIYNQYIEAFKQGVYDYIREDYDPTTQELIPRKYFSGGAALTQLTAGKIRQDFNGDDAVSSPVEDEAAWAASRPNSFRSTVFDVASSAVTATDDHVELAVAASPITDDSTTSSPLTFDDAVKTLRDPIAAFNFKSENIDIEQWLEYATTAYEADPANNQKPVRFAPDHTDLQKAGETIDRLVSSGRVPEGHFVLGAQNVRIQGDGAYTSHPPSIDKLKRLKVKFVIVGHSEITTRDRGEKSYVEPDELVGQKAKAVVDAGLQLIVAYGETIQQKKDEQTETVLTNQLSVRLGLLSPEEMLANETILAYEPVWAIGTDRVRDAEPADAEDNSKFSRQWLFDNKSPEVAAQTRIQFGGSVSGDTAPGYNKLPNVDGALVGSKSKEWATTAPIQLAFTHPNSTLDETALANEDRAKGEISGEMQIPATLNVKADTITTHSRADVGQQVTVNIRPLVAVEKERVRRVTQGRVDLQKVRVITMTHASVNHEVFLQFVEDPEGGVALVAIHETLLRPNMSSDEELAAIISLASSPVSQEAMVSAALERARKVRQILAHNKDAQLAYSEAIEKESRATRDALVAVVTDAAGVIKPMAVVTDILVDSKSSNFPENPIIILNPDGTRSVAIAGKQPANIHVAATSPEELTTILPTDGLPSGVAIQHVVIVVPKPMDAKTVKSKLTRDLFKVAKLDLTDKFNGTSDIVLQDGIQGVVDKGTFTVRNVDLGNGVEAAVIEAYIGYKREAKVTTFKTAIPAQAIEGLPYTTQSTQEVPHADLSSFPNAKARNFAIHGAGGVVARTEILTHMLLVAAGKVDPSKVKIPFLTNITPEYLERILNRDGELGGILDLSPGKDKFVDMGPDPKYPEIQRVYVQFRGHDFFFNLLPGYVNDIRKELAPYYAHYGIDVVLDGTDYQTEAEMRKHLTANVQGAINLSIGMKDATQRLPDAQVVVGSTDFEQRYHNALKPGGILHERAQFKTSCTGNCLIAFMDAIQYEGGLQGNMMRQWMNDVLVSAGLKDPSDTGADHLDIASFGVATWHAITQNRPLDSTQGHGTNLGALLKSSGGAKAAMYLDGVDPDNGAVAAIRLLTVNASIATGVFILTGESGLASEETLRSRLNAAQQGNKRDQLTVEQWDNTQQIRGRSTTALIADQAIRTQRLTDNAIIAKAVVGYPNVSGFAWNTLMGAYLLLAEMAFPQAQNIAGLLTRLENSGQVQVTGSSKSGHHYHIIQGQEALIRQPGEMLEYLRHEVRTNSNDGVKQEAARAIHDIAQELGIYATTADYLDRQSLGSGQGNLGDTFVGATFDQGSLSGGSRHAAEAIAKTVVETGAIPIINTGWNPYNLSAKTAPLHPYKSVGENRALPDEEIYEPDYLKEVKAEHLASLAMQGYVGPVFFRHTITMNPSEFKASEGEFGEVPVALDVAMDHAREQIRIAAESGHYNIGVDLTGVVERDKNKAMINLIKGKLGTVMSGYLGDPQSLLPHLIMGSKYGDSYYDAMKEAGALSDGEISFLKSVDKKMFAELITLYEALYEEAYTVARDLTEYTREVEKGLGFTTGPMSLQFEFNAAGDSLFHVIGSFIVREKLLQTGADREERSIASVAAPSRVVLRTDNPKLSQSLGQATQFMYDQHQQGRGLEGLDVDFIGISAKSPTNPKSIQKIVVGAVMDRFINEPDNMRVQQFGFELFQTFMGLAHGIVVPGSIAAEKVKALGGGLKARFRGVRQTDIKVIFAKMLGDAKLEGPAAERRVREIIAAIFTESDALPLKELSSSERKAFRTMVDTVLLAFKEEFLDLHPDAGLKTVQDKLARTYRDVNAPRNAHVARQILDQKATSQDVNLVEQDELARRGYPDFYPAAQASYLKETAEQRDERLRRRRELPKIGSSPIVDQGLPKRDAVVETDPANGRIIDRVAEEISRRKAAQSLLLEAADEKKAPQRKDDGGYLDAQLDSIAAKIRSGELLPDESTNSAEWRTVKQQIEATVNAPLHRDENALFHQNLQRFITNGSLYTEFGILRVVNFPDDQGTEHGALRHYMPNPASANIFQQVDFAIAAGANAIAVNMGNALQLLQNRYGNKIYIIVKMNGSLNTKYGNDKAHMHSAMHGMVKRLKGLGAGAIGISIYPGSTQSLEAIEELAIVSEEARAIGLNVVSWKYSRGGSLQKIEEDAFDVSMEDILFGDDKIKSTVLKVKLPPTDAPVFRSQAIRRALEDRGLLPKNQAEQHALLQRIAGDRILVHSGGEKAEEKNIYKAIAAIARGAARHAEEYYRPANVSTRMSAEEVREARHKAIDKALKGVVGTIMGRNAGHRPYKEAVEIFARVQALYLAAKMVIEADDFDAIVASNDSFIKWAHRKDTESPLSLVREKLKLDSLIVPEFGAQIMGDRTIYTPKFPKDPAKELVSRQYGHEPLAVQEALEEILMQGDLANTGHAAIVPFIPGQRIVKEVSAYSAPLDLLEEIAPRWREDAPKLALELSLNATGSRKPRESYNSAQTQKLLEQMERAKQLGANSIVLRFDITDDNYNSRAYQYIAVNEKARKLGLAVFTVGNTTYAETNTILKKPRAVDVIATLLYDLTMAKDSAGPVAIPVPKADIQDKEDRKAYDNRDIDLFDLHKLGDLESLEGLIRLMKFGSGLGFKKFLMALGLDGESPEQILRYAAAAQVGGAHGFILSRKAGLTADDVEQLLGIVKLSTGPNVARFKTGKALLKEAAAAASPVAKEKASSSPVTMADNITKGLRHDVSSPVGGINLNDAFLDKQVIRDGNGIPLPAVQQPIFQMEFDGLLPIITNVTIVPVSQLPLILGLNPVSDDNTGSTPDYSPPADKRDRFNMGPIDQLSFLN